MAVAKKRWGQHWLASDALAERLIEAIAPARGDRFLEIGPGTGRMTRALLARDVPVTAVEIDPDRVAELRTAFGDRAGFRVVHGDVLEIGDDVVQTDAPLRLVGNLPYNVGGPILRWTAAHRNQVRDAHYMLQLEVAARLCAQPGDPDYGLLSVRVQWEFDPSIVQRLTPGAFRPTPSVESAFVRLLPLTERAAAVPTRFEHEILEAGFAQRRKTLVNALGHAGHDATRVRNALRALGLDARVRAEGLSPGAWRALGAALGDAP